MINQAMRAIIFFSLKKERKMAKKVSNHSLSLIVSRSKQTSIDYATINFSRSISISKVTDA